MKKLILLIAAVFSINALAVTTDNNITNTVNKNINSATIGQMNKSLKLKNETQIRDLFSNTKLKVPGLKKVANPACAKACKREFDDCINAGYPWNSCNWEFQACADVCFAIPNC